MNTEQNEKIGKCELLRTSRDKQSDLLSDLIENWEQNQDKEDPQIQVYYKRAVLPKKAGLARLHCEEGLKEPQRNGYDIFIPAGEEWKLLWLTENQFLIVHKVVNPPYDGGPNPDVYEAWFGGTDEKPFLTRLEDHYWLTYWERDKVYSMLKPRIIAKFERKYKTKCKRQGDVFAVPYPVFPPGDILTNYVDSFRVFGRHRLKGELRFVYEDCREYRVVRGVITAPDHKPLILDEWHLLAQTSFLYDPMEAD